mmetsp:Transcript_22198/g.74684  ORF Transcript_22198/g.74684 Transcript_22198/m.74684 type:complete len:317 (-) Transcript_22198:692-1642(-)
MSSMRTMVTAASVANCTILILARVGSSTPAATLSRTSPLYTSSPVRARCALEASCCAAWCLARSLATRSVASCAPLMASCFGMTRSASAKAATASCSRVPSVSAKVSRYTLRAVSTAPPPGTTELDSRTRLTTHWASCRERSTSERRCSLAPRSSTEHALDILPPLTTMKSSSPTRCSPHASACPRLAGSTASSPSMLARVVSTVPPVSLAMRRRSSRLHLRAAMAPASTKYLRARSSIPFVVRITLAPAWRRSLMRLAVMSSSCWRMRSSSAGFVTSTCTPMCILDLRRSMSRRAMRAGSTQVGMPCAARPMERA